VTLGSPLLDHVPRRLPGVDSMAEVPAAVKQTMQQGTVGSNWQDDLSGITDNV
jgi:hypothetical protein